jgi:hypothetical protein
MIDAGILFPKLENMCPIVCDEKTVSLGIARNVAEITLETSCVVIVQDPLGKLDTRVLSNSLLDNWGVKTLLQVLQLLRIPRQFLISKSYGLYYGS